MLLALNTSTCIFRMVADIKNGVYYQKCHDIDCKGFKSQGGSSISTFMSTSSNLYSLSVCFTKENKKCFLFKLIFGYRVLFIVTVLPIKVNLGSF